MANKRQRIPKLRFTTWRKLGWHVAYRDPESRIPRKHVFGIRERDREPEARVLYHTWVLEHLDGSPGPAHPTKVKPPPKRKPKGDALSGSVLEIAGGLIEAEQPAGYLHVALRRLRLLLEIRKAALVNRRFGPSNAVMSDSP